MDAADRPLRPALPLGIAAAVGAVWLGFRLWTGAILEDALITFRHAENVAAGQGFGFNPGEWVQGTTTPLQTLLLAAVAATGGADRIPAAAAALGVLAGAATAGITADLLLRRGWPADGVAAAVLGWGTTPVVVLTGVGGMETPLVALCAALSLHALERGRSGAAAAACAAGALVRVDGILWAILLIGAHPRLARAAAAWTVPVLAWLGFATWAFGSPVPHAIVAKSVVNPREWSLVAPATALGHLEWFTESLSAPLPAVPLLGVALAVAGAVLALRRADADRVALAFAVLLFVGLYVGRAPRFAWYPVPAAWVAALLGAAAWSAAAGRLRVEARGVLVAAALLANLAGLRAPAREAWETQQNELRMRAEVGRWLDAHLPPDAAVAMEAIGWQGTTARRRVIDLAGLVSPEVVAIARAEPSNARRFARILAEQRPDALVLREWEVRTNRHLHGGPLFETPREKQAFLAAWREAARFEAPFPERMGRNGVVVVWVRK